MRTIKGAQQGTFLKIRTKCPEVPPKTPYSSGVKGKKTIKIAKST